MKPPSKFTRFAIATMMTLSFAGVACGSDDESSDTNPPAATEAPAATAATEATEAPAATEVTEATEAPVETTAPAGTEAPTETEVPADGIEGELTGVFSVDAAVCADGPVTSGSYFRMVQIGGTLEAGPFIPNADSLCGDPTFSGLVPGTDGGLVTGTHQAAPDPAFDDAGNGLAGAIFEPVTFFAVAFAGATDPAEAVPAITAADGVLSGDLSAFTAYYGGGQFNQGAPKPDGSGTAPVGTIDPATGAYVLDWSSLISGGSFDGFTGVWHLEGTFTPA
jgi:hypothetical protein